MRVTKRVRERAIDGLMSVAASLQTGTDRCIADVLNGAPYSLAWEAFMVTALGQRRGQGDSHAAAASLLYAGWEP